MRKISIFLGVIFSCLLFSSCHEEVENWDSAVLDYSGRYVVVRLLDEDGQTINDYDGTEIQLYNSAANLANEMWIDDFQAIFPLKTKINFSGTIADFASLETDFNKLPDNQYAFSEPSAAPTADGQTETISGRYLRAALLEGKITPDGFTTKGGNITSAIRIKVKLYVGNITFTSYTKPETEWANPTIPEYAWKQSGMEHTSDKDKTYIIEGYLYTGYSEDDF